MDRNENLNAFQEKIKKRNELKSIYISRKESKKIGIEPIDGNDKNDKIEYLYYNMHSGFKIGLKEDDKIEYKKKDRYSIKEMLYFANLMKQNNYISIENLKDLITSQIEYKNDNLVLECLSLYFDEYIRLKYIQEKQDNISLIINNEIFDDFPQLNKFFVDLFKIDLFNGVFDRKYVFLKKKDLFENINNFNDLVILYRYLKFCLFVEKSKENFDKLEDLLIKIRGSQGKNQNIINYCTKQKYSEELYEMVKNKYNEFFDFFYENIPIKDNNLLFSNGYYNAEFDRQLGAFEKSIIMEDYNCGLEKEVDLSNTLYFNYLDCSILTTNYKNDSLFYLKLIKCLIYICSNSIYPFCNIENSMMLLFDIMHLNKKNIPLQYFSQYLYCIYNLIKKNQNIILKFFVVPLFQLKILIFFHDIWDILIQNKIEYANEDFYIIKNIIEILNNNHWFKVFVESIKSINYLYYYFIFKKAVRKIQLKSDLYGSIKYLQLVSGKNTMDEELKDVAKKWLNNINLELGLKLIND